MKYWKGVTTNTGATIYGERLEFIDGYPVIVSERELFKIRVLPETLGVEYTKDEDVYKKE